MKNDKYTISDDGQSITCHKCGRTSNNPGDIREKYCGFCHEFHEDCPTLYAPREGDLPREELVRRADLAIEEWGEGTQILFKYTCEWCGERCTLQEPNMLYENGECFKCGKTTPIRVGGFTIMKTYHPRAKKP